MTRFTPADVDHLLDSAPQQRHLHDDVPEGFFQRNEERILQLADAQRRKQQRSRLTWFSAAAAVILAFTTIATRWVMTEYNTIMQTDELYTIHCDDDYSEEFDALEELEENDLFIQYL